jgi:hypothetical protein
MGIVHLDDAPFHERERGFLRGRWTMVGEAAGCEKVGVRRIQVPAGGRSTPAHGHGLGYYPRSHEIAIRGIGLVARLERLDYWDGED